MIKGLLLTLACAVLHTVSPETLGLREKFSLTKEQLDSLIWYLKWGLTPLTVVEINSVLNRWAENRWAWKKDTSDWDWKSEIAVVTGGSGGIGACVVKKLVSHGIRVAVLDPGPLSESFTAGMHWAQT